MSGVEFVDLVIYFVDLFVSRLEVTEADAQRRHEQFNILLCCLVFKSPDVLVKEKQIIQHVAFKWATFTAQVLLVGLVDVVRVVYRHQLSDGVDVE